MMNTVFRLHNQRHQLDLVSDMMRYALSGVEFYPYIFYLFVSFSCHPVEDVLNSSSEPLIFVSRDPQNLYQADDDDPQDLYQADDDSFHLGKSLIILQNLMTCSEICTLSAQ